MIGLLLIYAMGKWMYSLAQAYGKNKWVFAILGVIVFYASQFFLGMVLGIFMEELFFETSSIVLNLIGVIIGVLGVWIFRSILKSAWKKEALQSSNSELLDDASDF